MKLKPGKILKSVFVVLYFAAILFPLFLPGDPAVHSEPADQSPIAPSAAKSTLAISGSPGGQADAASSTLDPDFPLEKVVLFASLFGVVAIAFMKWGINAKKTKPGAEEQDDRA